MQRASVKRDAAGAKSKRITTIGQSIARMVDPDRTTMAELFAGRSKKQRGRLIRSVDPLPPTPPLSTAERAGMRRVAIVKNLRWNLGLSQEDFAKLYGIPLETLKAWERRTAEPTETEAVYLALIERDPEAAKRIPA